MQQTLQNKVSHAMKFSGLAVFSAAVLVFGLILAVPTQAATIKLFVVEEGVGEWELGAGSSKVEAVTSNDGDTSYIKETADDDVQTFLMEDADLPPGTTINSVGVSVFAAGTSSGIQLRLASSTSPNDSATASLTGSYAEFNRVDTVNPFTDVAWTVDEVNSWVVRFGVQYVDQNGGLDNTDEARITQIYVVIDYTLPVDTTAPTLTPPAEQIFQATGFLTTPVPPALVLATATDLVDLAPVVTFSPISFPLGTTTVLWQAMDASGNTSTATSSVIIIDTTAPVITLHGDVTITLTVGDSYVEQGASVTDNYDSEMPAPTVGGDVVNTTVAGTYRVTYDAHDVSGNTTVQQVRTVVVNNLPSTGGTSGGGSSFVEPTPPSFGNTPITVGGGLGSTSTIQLTFDVTNASWVAISETPDFSGTSWVPYTTNTTFTFSGFNTARKLYIKFRRINGGETKVQEVTVLLNSPSTLIQAVLGAKITRLSELMAKLKLGSRGAEVVELQELLKQAGVFPANQAATGYYGPITQAAVNKAIAASKVVLGIKISRVDELVAKLKLGDNGAEVVELQNLLKQAGYFPAAQTATGYYGPITNAAVKKYLAATK